MTTIALAFSFEALLVGRLIVGVGVGMGFSVCPQYIAEISPTGIYYFSHPHLQNVLR
jgi:MFS family permease